jgi:hypothetical protein
MSVCEREIEEMGGIEVGDGWVLWQIWMSANERRSGGVLLITKRTCRQIMRRHST